MDVLNKISLKAEAEKLVEEKGFSEECVSVLTDLITSDQDLVSKAVRELAISSLSDARHAARSRIAREQTKGDKPKIFSPSFQESVSFSCGKYFNWPMMDGSFLSMADKTHLLLDAMKYRKNARGNFRNARFLELVAEKIRPGQKVEEVLTERQLANLMAKAVEEVLEKEV